MNTKLKVTTIMLGVKDVDPAKKFYVEEWGGYYGYFSDLDGYLWKVATAS